MMRILFRCLLGLSVLVVASCGYQLGTSPRLPKEGRAAYVPVFENRTPEVGVESFFTDAFRQEMQRHHLEGGAASDLKIVGRVEDVVTSGLVSAVAGSPTQTLSVQSAVSHYRVQATVRLRVMKGEAMVVTTQVSGEEPFLPGATDPKLGLEDPARYEANRRLAIARLSERLMQQAFENLTTQW